MTLTVTFRLGTDPDKAQQLVQNRVAAGRAAAAGGGAPARHHHHEELARPDHGRASAVAERPLRHDVSAQLRRAQRQGPAGADRRRRRRPALRRRRLFDARLARSAEGRRARPDRRATSSRAIQAQNVEAAAGVVGASPSVKGLDLQLSRQRRGPALSTEEQFGDIVVKTGSARRGHAAARRRAHRARRVRIRPALAARQQAGGRDPDLPGAGLERDADLRQRPRDDGRDQEEHARKASTYQIVYDPTQFVRSSIEAVIHTLLEAIALVVLVVILFLQTWRASIIPLLAVPVSIVGTFAVMHVLRLLDQRAQPVRPGARDRHRRRRRHRRGRERRAQHRSRPVAARGDLPGDARSVAARSSRSRWCWSRCSCRWPSSAA